MTTQECQAPNSGRARRKECLAPLVKFYLATSDNLSGAFNLRTKESDVRSALGNEVTELTSADTGRYLYAVEYSGDGTDTVILRPDSGLELTIPAAGRDEYYNTIRIPLLPPRPFDSAFIGNKKRFIEYANYQSSFNLSGGLNGETPDNAATLVLSGTLPGASANAQSGALFKALALIDLSYVKLDLSALTGMVDNVWSAEPANFPKARNKVCAFTLPAGVTKIMAGAFQDFVSLRDFSAGTAPISVIGAKAFFDCINLRSLDLSSAASGLVLEGSWDWGDFPFGGTAYEDERAASASGVTIKLPANISTHSDGWPASLWTCYAATNGKAAGTYKKIGHTWQKVP
jgi:hypothetical protein